MRGVCAWYSKYFPVSHILFDTGHFNKSKTLHGRNRVIFREHLFNIWLDESRLKYRNSMFIRHLCVFRVVWAVHASGLWISIITLSFMISLVSVVSVLVTRFIDNFLVVNLEMGSHGRDVIEQNWLSDLFYWVTKKAIKEWKCDQILQEKKIIKSRNRCCRTKIYCYNN